MTSDHNDQNQQRLAPRFCRNRRPFSLLTGVFARRKVETYSRAASFWEVVAMILRGLQIQRDGHGKCGLLPNPTLSSNTAQLPFSGALANTQMSLGHSVVSHHHFIQGGIARVRL